MKLKKKKNKGGRKEVGEEKVREPRMWVFNDGQGIECYNLVGNKREGQGVHMYTHARAHTHT